MCRCVVAVTMTGRPRPRSGLRLCSGSAPVGTGRLFSRRSRPGPGRLYSKHERHGPIALFVIYAGQTGKQEFSSGALGHIHKVERNSGRERMASSTPPPTDKALSETIWQRRGSFRASISPIFRPRDATRPGCSRPRKTPGKGLRIWGWRIFDRGSGFPRSARLFRNGRRSVCAR